MLTIYLADLTHTTIVTSNDGFPLNVGLVSAYFKVFYPEADVRLFKYPDKLLQAIKEKTPDVIGVSNYPWNTNLGLSILRYVKKVSPQTITVMGGPNISYIPKDQEDFLTQNSDCLDFYVLYEGEQGFKQLIDLVVEKKSDILAIKQASPKGCLYLKNGELARFEMIERNSNLDSYPSPYLSGTLDGFFDNKLSPMIETHRGCPYTCAYCHEGHLSYSKINQFSMERIMKELDYIASHVSKNVSNLHITDPNFGLFSRDTEIAKAIVRLSEETGYPKIVFATTAKNNHERLIQILRIFGSKILMPLWMSVQSMSEVVLRYIRRQNISLDSMYQVQEAVREEHGTTKSELIMCLPGETYETHLQALVELMKLNIDQIICYQLMFLNGTQMKQDELDNPGQHGYVKKYRVLPNDFSDLPEAGRSLEIEEIIVANNTWKIEDYGRARIMHLMVMIYYNAMSFKGYFRLIIEEKMDLYDFITKLLKNFSEHKKISYLLDEFSYGTQKELFDSKEDLINFYTDDNNFKLLIEGKIGSNLIHKYQGLAFLKHIDDLLDIIDKTILEITVGKQDISEKVKDVMQFYRLSYKGYLDPMRQETQDGASFNYDIPRWLIGNENLDNCHFKESRRVIFSTPAEKFKLLEDYYERYGRGESAFSKILTKLWVRDLFRVPRYLD
ncbi:radical SAM protein [Candidatus Parcubacteria bacterium]|nr:radical SAM protein [Candidatus Parcubacteria bacterium]